jgi:SAM-dependent methyltransferase
MISMDSIYAPIFRYFRRKRLRRFYRVHRVTAKTRVLDLGGSRLFWDMTESVGLPRPRVTILNLSGAVNLRADARFLPFADQSFDLIFCNSVIEHVGKARDQKMMADEIRRVGRSWWVQTPDPRFPVEPHYIGLFVHWLPLAWRGGYARWCSIRGWLDPAESRRLPGEVRLISAREMREFFPGRNLIVERFLGFPKSLISSATNDK